MNAASILKINSVTMPLSSKPAGGIAASSFRRIRPHIDVHTCAGRSSSSSAAFPPLALAEEDAVEAEGEGAPLGRWRVIACG